MDLDVSSFGPGERVTDLAGAIAPWREGGVSFRDRSGRSPLPDGPRQYVEHLREFQTPSEANRGVRARLAHHWARKRRCRAAVRSAEMRPARSHRASVSRCTPNSAATSVDVKSCSPVPMCIGPRSVNRRDRGAWQKLVTRMPAGADESGARLPPPRMVPPCTWSGMPNGAARSGFITRRSVRPRPSGPGGAVSVAVGFDWSRCKVSVS